MWYFRAWHILNTVAHHRLHLLLPAHPLRTGLGLVLWLFPGRWRHSEGSDAERLRRAFEDLGPLFIKLGQLLSTRRDLLAPDIADALATLQDKVPPFEHTLAMQRIAAELGKPINTVFAKVCDTPMASASIAQVYAATLQNGDEVVIKIRRPGLHRIVEADLRLLKQVARILERVWSLSLQFHPLRVVEDYEQVILGELDLSLEAANAQRMASHFPFSDLLYIPAVYAEYTTPRMMVVERIHGIPVNNAREISEAGIDLQQLAERGVRIFFTQVFVHNFFHADMHPGNIFVARENPASPRYLTIDCAIVGSLSRQDQLLLARLALLVLQKDFRRMVELIRRAGWIQGNASDARLEAELAKLISPIFDQPLDQIAFAPMLMQLLDMARRYHIEAPIQYLLLVKTLIHIEGLGRQIYPQLDIWTIGKPMLESWLWEQVGPTAMAREISYKLPEWLAVLPELPQLMYDALHAEKQNERQVRELLAQNVQLQKQLRRGFIGGAMIMAGLMTIVIMAPATYKLTGGLLVGAGLVAVLRR